MPPELLNQPACQEILAQYGQSFKDVLSFENIPNNPESHEIFNQMLTNIRKRHQVSSNVYNILVISLFLFLQDTIPRMADALHSLREEGKLNVNTKDRLNTAIQYALDRLYMSRISIHM